MACLIRIGAKPFASRSVLNNLTKSEINCVRTITSKLMRCKEPERPPKPAPYNYKEKSYGHIAKLLDRTTPRLDENSKLIVVEGSVASGKSKFAKELAEELDMFYFPEANQDMLYINDYGFDLKTLDDQLPPSCRSFDIKNFLVTPKHMNTAIFQLRQYMIKYSQYIDALAHLLSTGQGVILDRCVYSDFVFLEAMRQHNYISKSAYELYYEVRENTISELLRPHLIVYLDQPVSKIQQNIQKRNISCEAKSPVLTQSYLETLEKFYKQEYLKKMSPHSELLIYDWSEGGEVEIVIEDIERINFDKFDLQDVKFQDWAMPAEEDWAITRNLYADRKDHLLAYFNVPMYHVPELCAEAEDALVYWDVIQNAPGEKFESGYNADMGDKSLLFKTKSNNHDSLPLRERKL